MDEHISDGVENANWQDVSRRAGLASHRLIGWIYWDPRAIELYTALGVPNGMGYYIASRAAPLAPAGHQAVAAAFYSIHPGFIEFSLTTASQHTSWSEIMRVRNQAVGEGLRRYVPEIVDGLAALGDQLWAVVDGLPEAGRVCFAAHRQAARADDPLVSAWLAVNCLREWRGDTHFALLVAEDVDRVQAGLLHDAHLNYGGWIARSRGADDAAISAAFVDLERRGLAARGRVNSAGEELRRRIEDRTDELCQHIWRRLGREGCDRFLELIEPVGQRLLSRIDDTAGPEWMPAARERRP
ncbi:MAG: SCO6745 family protein [Ilumatobacteraceae bacterium]